MKKKNSNSKWSQFLAKLQEVFEILLILIKAVPKIIQNLIQRIKHRKDKPPKSKEEIN